MIIQHVRGEGAPLSDRAFAWAVIAVGTLVLFAASFGPELLGWS